MKNFASAPFRVMEGLTPSPSAPAVDWQSISALWNELSSLANCPQDHIHHAEGDVGTHTRMVLECLVDDLKWRGMDDQARFRLFWTAVFHDIGKPATTVHEPDGRITSAGHSATGARIARSLMWEAGLPMLLREDICAMISTHQLPFWLYERTDAEKTACRVSLSMIPSELLVHASADARGRECPDKADMLDRVELSGAVFEEMGILDGPFPFANDESRFAYFEKEERNPWYAAHEEFRCEATLVCGLPGTGKDTWIARHLSERPAVSLDRIREELGIGPLENQGRVIQEGFEQARVHLRASRDFTWNATNVTRSNREKIVRLLRDYNARIRIVYLEASPEVLFEQNSARKGSVPADAILRLARKMEPPRANEGHEVRWIRDGAEVFRCGQMTAPPASPVA